MFFVVMGGSIEDMVELADRSASLVVSASDVDAIQCFLEDRKIKDGFREKLVETLSQPFYLEALHGYFRAGEEEREDLGDIIHCFVTYCADVSNTDHRIYGLIESISPEKRKKFLKEISPLFRDRDEQMSLCERLHQLKDLLPFDIPLDEFTSAVYYNSLCPRTSLFTANILARLTEGLDDPTHDFIIERIQLLNSIHPSIAAYASSSLLDLIHFFNQSEGKFEGKAYLGDFFRVSEFMGMLDPVITSVYLHTLPILVEARKEGQSFDFEENPFTVGFTKLCMGMAATSYQSRKWDGRQYRVQENRRRLSSSIISVLGEHERLERFILDDCEIQKWFDGESRVLRLGFPSNFLTSFVHSIKNRDIFNSDYGHNHAKTGFNLLNSINPRHIIANKELINRHYGTLFGHMGKLLNLMEGFTDEVLISFLVGQDKVDDYFDGKRREEKISAQESIVGKIIYGLEVFNVFKAAGRLSDPFPELYAKKIVGDELLLFEEETLNMIFDIVEDYDNLVEDLKTYACRTIERQIGLDILDISDTTKFWYQTANQVKGFMDLSESEEGVLSSSLELCIQELLDTNSASKISLVDLGCGDGQKSLAIYDLFSQKEKNSNLYFCDSSDEFLRIARSKARDKDIRARKVKLDLFYPITQYFEFRRDEPHLFLFLGQTLGNFDEPERVIRNISDAMKGGDYFALEVDLEKDLNKYRKGEKMIRAYAKVIGFSNDDLDYHLVEHKWGIDTYFTLKQDVEVGPRGAKVSLRKGQQLLVAKSAQFNRDKVLDLIGSQNLELQHDCVTPQGKLVAVFQKP